MGVFDLFRPDDADDIFRKEIRGWARDLQSENPVIRQNAGQCIEDAGFRALAPLLEIIPSVDEPDKVRILTVLQKIPGISPYAICNGLKTTCRMKTRDISGLLAGAGPNSIPDLLKYLVDDEPDVRSIAADALERIGEPAVPVLVKALNHRSHRVRSGAAEALAHMKWTPRSHDEQFRFLVAQQRWAELIRAKKAAVPYLITILPDRYYRVRIGAAKTLGAIGDPRAVQPLGELMADPETEVCISAVEALGAISHENAVRHLIAGLDHESHDVRHMAAAALSTNGWTPQTLEEKTRFYLATEQWHELTRLGKPAIPYLVLGLGKPQAGLHAGIGTALKGMGRPGTEALAVALSHENPSIRKAAAALQHDIKRRRQPDRPAESGRDPLSTASPQKIRTRSQPPANIPEPSRDSQSSSEPAHPPAYSRPDSGKAAKQVDTRSDRRRDIVQYPESAFSKVRNICKPEATARSPDASRERPQRLWDTACSARNEEGTREDDERDIQQLIGCLSSRDPEVRTIAIDALGRAGPMAISALAGALGDSSWEVRMAAAEALGRIQDGRAVPPLVNALQDTDDDVRATAACALGQIGEFSAFVPLVKMLEDVNSNVRLNAESAIAAFGRPAADMVRKLVSHTNPQVRGSVATILGKICGKEAEHDLAALIGDPERMVREKAAVALGRTVPGAIPLLARMLETGDPEHRRCAVIALGHAGPDATEYLLSACRDSNPAVRDCAQAFLDTVRNGMQHFAGQESRHEISPSSDIPYTRASLKRVAPIHRSVGQLEVPVEPPCRSSPAFPVKAITGEDNELPRVHAPFPEHDTPIPIWPLIEALSSPVPKDRILAVQALGRIGDIRAVPPLVSILEDQNCRLQKATAEALGQIGDPRAIPALTRLIEDPAEEIRKSAVYALGMIRDDDAIPGLLAALTDDDYSIRADAVEIFIRKGDAAVPSLIRALSHPLRKIRRESASCLDQMGWEPGCETDRVSYLIAREAWVDLSGMESAALAQLSRLVLGSDEEDLRMGGIITLVKMEHLSAIDLLIQALRDRSFLIRRKAMNALVDKGEPAVHPLREAAKSEDPHIRAASEQIIERIGRKCSA